MNMTKRVLDPERLRQVPAQFSWIDHRLVREHYVEKADVCAWTLYLFLVCVADARGLSYYAEATLCRQPQAAPDPARAGPARSHRVGSDRV